MVLGDIVGEVGGPRSPIVAELILRFAAADPVETYVHRLGAYGHNGVVCDTRCRQIIGLDRSSRLRPTNFNEGLMQWYHVFGHNEESREFSFRCQ